MCMHSLISCCIFEVTDISPPGSVLLLIFTVLASADDGCNVLERLQMMTIINRGA